VSPIVETRRLEMRKLTADDIDLLHQLTGDREVMKFFPHVLSYDETRQMLDKILDHYERHGHCFWKVLLKTSGDFIGIAGLLHQEIDGEAETEISYRIRREYWNNGYATEAAHACKEYGEGTLGKKRLISLILPRNNASRRVAEKLGARKATSIIFMEEEHDVYCYYWGSAPPPQA